MERQETAEATRTRSGRPATLLMLVALLLLAYNLRPTATQIGPVMPDLRRDLGMGAGVAGVLAALPTLCFGVFGFLAPGLAARLGTHRLLLGAMAAVTVGAAGRSMVSDPWLFLALSGVALAGMATGNVIAPSVIRHHFPHKIGFITALYSLVLSIGVAVSSALTVPMTTLLGGWRAAFLSSTSIALLALVPWALAVWRVPEMRPARSTRDAPVRAIPVSAVAHTPLGWALGIFFGLQSAQAYTTFAWLPTLYMDAGLSQELAGWMLGLVTGLGIPLAFVIPNWVARWPSPLGMMLVISACGTIAYVGLLLVPATLPWLWSVLLAIGLSNFPLILALFGLKARTAAGTAGLSGFAQGLGYLVALGGPFSVGLMYGRTGTWTASLVMLIGASLLMTVAGVVTIRRPLIEDELGH